MVLSINYYSEGALVILTLIFKVVILANSYLVYK